MLPGDLSRNVVCIMGLPFDAVGMSEAVERVQTAARQRIPLMVSTVNLNFAVAARADEAFRDSIVHSQLSLADGMPIVWVSRLLGLPVRERVSGADLFEALGRATGPPVKVFFFGGARGVAQRACEQVNLRYGGIRCVGFESPGFGSLEDMSSDDCIERINIAGADFIVVSLGAKKGQAWIERNRARLSAPIISHLGAVVNFAAGTVRRAPVWLQRMGLEWAWRIKEESGLWRRYAGDAAVLARMLVGGVFPLYWQRVLASRGGANPTVELSESDSVARLKLAGDCCVRHADLLRSVFARAAMARRVNIDMSGVERVDATVIGTLLLLSGQQRDAGGILELSGASKALRRQFRYHGAEFLLATGDSVDRSGPPMGN